jgi:hypothetical protein
VQTSTRQLVFCEEILFGWTSGDELRKFWIALAKGLRLEGGRESHCLNSSMLGGGGIVHRWWDALLIKQHIASDERATYLKEGL